MEVTRLKKSIRGVTSSTESSRKNVEKSESTRLAHSIILQVIIMVQRHIIEELSTPDTSFPLPTGLSVDEHGNLPFAKYKWPHHKFIGTMTGSHLCTECTFPRYHEFHKEN